MSKTTKKSKTKRYCVELGNLDVRPGHRVNCAQVQVQVFVDATSPEQAAQRVRDALDDDGVLCTGTGRMRAVVRFAPDRVRPADATEVTDA